MTNTISKALLSLCIATTLANAEARAAERPLKLGTLLPRGSSFHQTLQQMAIQWKSAGTPITIYPDGARGGEAEMVRLMRTGVLDACVLSATGLTEIDRSITAVQMIPMAFDSLEEMDFVISRLRGQLEETLRQKGFVVLFWSDAGWVRFFSSKPFTTPDEMKKLKLFTWAGDANVVDVYKSAGFRPVALETGDILPSLQTGMIDVVPLPPTIAIGMQVYGSARYMLELNWGPLVGALVIREKSWNKLPPDTRLKLQQAADEAGKRMTAQSRIESDRSVEAMKKRGLKVQAVSKEGEEQWRRVAEQAYPQLRGRVIPGPIFDQVRTLIAEYRRARAADRRQSK